MRYLRKFDNNAEYKEYLASRDTWIPCVSYIKNGHDERIDPTSGRDSNMEENDWSVVKDKVNGLPLGGDNKRWVDFVDLGKHFIEYYNNGTLSFTDIQDVDLYQSYIYNGSTAEDASAATWYRASYDSETGTIDITTPEGKATFDDSTGILKFYNFPNDYTVFGGPAPTDRYTAYFGFADPSTPVDASSLNTRVVFSTAGETFDVSNFTDGYQYYLALPDDISLNLLSTVGAGELYFPFKEDGSLYINTKLYKKYVTDGNDEGYKAGEYSFVIKTTKN